MAGKKPVVTVSKEAEKKPDPVKGLEVRGSLIETLDGVHTKHISFEITDPDTCQSILTVLEEAGADLAGAEDASKIEIKPEEEEKTAGV